jgi:4-aminobutyrate aminotransferase-like enzyme/Ser/Thr protein kinase RdoA (MazF antagonist)
MSLLERAPRLGIADAIKLARTLYGLEASAEPLTSERDQNFLLESDKGRFVLKLANGLESRSLLEGQNAAMAHLAATISFCPRVIPTSEGDLIAREPTGHFVRLVTWLPGVALGRIRYHSPAVLEDLGRRVGLLDKALASFDHPALHRVFHWDLAHAFGHIDSALTALDAEWRATIAREVEGLHARLTPHMESLRRSIIHNDVNDYNVLVIDHLGRGQREQEICGIIDFGDMVHSYTVGDLAVAIAYGILGKSAPLLAATHIVRGYHLVHPLQEQELTVLFDLVKLRLCLSAALAVEQQQQRPGDEYLTISQLPIRKTLPKLLAIHTRFAEATFRHVCGLPASSKTDRVITFLKKQPAPPNGLVGNQNFDRHALTSIDLSVGSPLIEGDPAANEEQSLTRRIVTTMADAGATIAVGGYLEARTLYRSPSFVEVEDDGIEREPRTIHLGLDYFTRAETPVHVPLSGTVHAFCDNRQALDYGPVVILRHTSDAGDEFYTLYGHLSRQSLAPLRRGMRVQAGDTLGEVGSTDENGGWTPHLHFQLITDLLDMDCNFPGVCRASETRTWAALSPDPNLIAKLSALPPSPTSDVSSSLAARLTHVGSNVRAAYREPVKIARGWMQYLYDASGRRLLDAYNNVPHVGHCHPRVVRAAAEQLRVLNTNTRYLHDTLERYASRLTATLPDPLSICYFVNSGSEANELALRLARAHTGQRDVIVLDHAYHGITTSLIQISPYKFNGPGGEGKEPWVHVAPLPDVYRGMYRDDPSTTARRYGDDVTSIIEQIRSTGRGVSAFVAESAPSVGGQIILPPGYLSRVYAHIRSAGGLCIADEVQTAYGRIGSHFFAFEAQDVVPDIVVLGKPIGNGYPLGAVITTPGIARSFDNGMEFFSTFGGSTVSCAVGLAVLEVVQQERLQQHAHQVGAFLVEKLRQLGNQHSIVGDVRGSGFFLGVELVTDREARTPASGEAHYIVNRLREEGILIGTEGADQNVLKVRPPMPFTTDDAEGLANILGKVLGELQ